MEDEIFFLEREACAGCIQLLLVRTARKLNCLRCDQVKIKKKKNRPGKGPKLFSMNQPGRGPQYRPSERSMNRSSGDQDQDGDQIAEKKH